MFKINQKFKSFIFIFSLLLNSLFILLFVTASFSKNTSLFYHSPDSAYSTAAAVVSVPSGSQTVFEQITLTLKQGDNVSLQFIVVSEKKQASLLINAIYDPEVVSVEQTGYGLSITALSTGQTLLQTVTNNGIKNVALITVE